MDMSEDFDWSQLDDIEKQSLIDNAEDEVFYGMKGNQYNPEVHMGCAVQGIETFDELIDVTYEMLSLFTTLQEHGWELSEPVDGGMIYTEWKGEGSPPKADSQFNAEGYDLDGNHIEDF